MKKCKWCNSNIEDTAVICPYCKANQNSDNKVNVKIFHPVNGSYADVSIPKEMIFLDVLIELIEANFLTSGYEYAAVLKSESNIISLDNNKTISQNGIKDFDSIRIITCTEAGGIDKLLADIWEFIYPYLDQFGTICGIAGSAIGLGSWIKNKFSRKYTFDSFLKYISNKEEWDIQELSRELYISKKEAKELLKGFGYKKDKKSSLYIKTSRTDEIIESINKIIPRRL